MVHPLGTVHSSHNLVEGATAAGNTLGHVAHSGAEHVDGGVIIHGLLPLLEALVGDGAADESLSLIHISEPTRLLSISYAVFCLKKKKKNNRNKNTNNSILVN
eukprot:TRINITY_DN1229_c0_g1_i2.p1 TRINITY_DN1229_c0_g1~~TRINITY_DN1229_c0_g1_i2.p1  ORF type:complete len:103 (-),score=16.45 TRINITY_DN1229_c0_g1_i2:88-396(-)